MNKAIILNLQVILSCKLISYEIQYTICSLYKKIQEKNVLETFC